MRLYVLPLFLLTEYLVLLAAAAATVQYMGPDSDNCGGPFCDRMVMTLQGTLYYLYYVYSYWGEAFTENDNCYSLYADPRWGCPGLVCSPSGQRRAY